MSRNLLANGPDDQRGSAGAAVSVPEGIGANRTGRQRRRHSLFARPTPPWRRRAPNERIEAANMAIVVASPRVNGFTMAGRSVTPSLRATSDPLELAGKSDVGAADALQCETSGFHFEMPRT